MQFVQELGHEVLGTVSVKENLRHCALAVDRFEDPSRHPISENLSGGHARGSTQHDTRVIEHGPEALHLVPALSAAQEDVLDAHVYGEDIGGCRLVVSKAKLRVVPIEEPEDRLLRLVFEQEAQVVFGERSRFDEDPAEVGSLGLLHRESLAERLFGDLAAGDEEMAEHIGGFLRRAGNDPPLTDENPLDDLVPLDGKGSGLAGVPQPLKDFGQGHRGQAPLDRHRAPQRQNLGRKRPGASFRRRYCSSHFRHLD